MLLRSMFYHQIFNGEARKSGMVWFAHGIFYNLALNQAWDVVVLLFDLAIVT